MTKNPILTNVDGVNNITSVGGRLFIFDNDALLNIDGLSSITNLEGDIEIKRNSSLTTINGLLSITYVNGKLSVYNNDALTNIDGLSNITVVDGGLYINGDLITNLDGLSSLTSVNGELNLGQSNVLTNIEGLSNLSTVGTLMVYDNDALSNLDGLSSLTSIGQLVVRFNNILNNLDGLINVNTIGNIIIRENHNLENLDGLSNLTSVNYDLSITTNFGLSSFCGLYHLLNSNGLNGSYDVSGNQVNPSIQEIIAIGPCEGLSIDNKPILNDFELRQNFPNPFNPITTISYRLDKDNNVLVKIYDVSGQFITTLRDEYQIQGEYSIIWDGTDDLGRKVGAGIYLYQLQKDGFVQTNKMILLK